MDTASVASALLCSTFVQDLLDRHRQFLRHPWFHDERIHPQGLGFFGIYEMTEARTENDRNIRADTAQFCHQGCTRHGRHRLIRDDQVKTLGSGTKGFQGVETAGASHGVVAQMC